MAFPYAEERRARKRKLLELIKAHPDKPLEKIVSIYSASTGLSHAKINIYIDELKKEGSLTDKDLVGR